MNGDIEPARPLDIPSPFSLWLKLSESDSGVFPPQFQKHENEVVESSPKDASCLPAQIARMNLRSLRHYGEGHGP